MFVKVLVGVFATAVLGTGGYAYFQYTGGLHCCGTEQVAPSPGADGTAPCCLQAPPTSCSEGSNCCKDGEATPEVLSIEPREVK